MRIRVAAALVAFLMVQACSSRPRDFTPTLGVATVDEGQFDAALDTCKQLFVTGKLDSSGKLASGGAGAAAGVAMGAGGAVAASSAGLYAGAAVASATIIAIPFVALGGAWGLAKIKRHHKEKAIQTAMTGCLRERGYEVSAWKRTPKAKRQEVASKLN